MARTTEETQPVETAATLTPGEPCPCCGRKVPAPKATSEEAKAKERERRKEYNAKPEVKERQAEYRKQRSARLREAMALLEAQESAEPDDLLDPPTEQGVI